MMSAATFVIMVVMMMLMIVVMSAAALVMVVMMMLVIVVMSAATFIIMVMMVMMLMIVVMSAAALIIMVVMMLVIVVMSATALIIMGMMMMLMLLFQQLIRQRYRMLHNLQDFLSIQLLNRSGNNSCLLIDRTKKLHRLHCFLLVYNIGTAHDNRACILNLIVKELAEVSHIHFAFLGINNCGVAVQLNINILFHTLYSLDNVGKLTNT